MEMGDVQYLCPVKHVVLHREEGDVAVEEAYVSVMRAPMEVLTHGYYEVDPPHRRPQRTGSEIS